MPGHKFYFPDAWSHTISTVLFTCIPSHDLQGNGSGRPPSKVYGSTGNSRGPVDDKVLTFPEASGSTRSRGTSTPLTVSAKPLGQFAFLERSYTIKTPSCFVPRINELFKSICDRYDVAVVNREKVDEALILFKQVLGMDRVTSMEVCFSAWRDCLSDPKFTISFQQETGSVKTIRVRAGNIPREKRKAQKHIRDLLDACHLYLQQKDFLQTQINADLIQLGSLSGQLQDLGKECGLAASDRKQLPKTFSMAMEEFSRFSDILDLFFAHVYSLMNEINKSVHVLEARESSLERY